MAQAVERGQAVQSPGTVFLDNLERDRRLQEAIDAPPGQNLDPQAPDVVAALAVQDGPCFDIYTISVVGVTLIEAAEIDVLSAPYEGRCLGEVQIDALIQAIGDLYIGRGYIFSRAYIQEQDLTDGTLDLTVVEGRIASLALQDPSGKISETGLKRKLWAAFPIAEGDVLELRALEQGIDQLDALPSQQAAIDILPGESVGDSIVVVSVAQEDRFRGLVGFDNDGAGTDEAFRVRLGVSADDLLRLNETWSAYVLSAEGSDNAVGSVRVPFRWATLFANVSYSDSAAFLTDTADLVTRTLQVGGGAEVTVLRDANRKIKAAASLNRRRRERFVNDAQLTPQDETVARFGFQYELREPGSVLLLDGGLSAGIQAFGADGKDFDKSTPKPRFVKLDGTMQAVMALPGGLQYFGSAVAQHSFSGALRSDDQISVASRYGIRGTEASPLSFDSGIVSRNEISYRFSEENAQTLSVGWDRGTRFLQGLQPYGFIDYGVGRVYSLGKNRAGFGGGVGLRYAGERVTFDASVARGRIIDGQSPETEFYFNLTFKPF